MEQVKKIALIGASGKAGKYLVKQLISRGYNIKVLLRNPEKININSNLIEKIKGDARNYDSVNKLLNECSALISTLGQPKGEKLVFSRVAINIVKSMNSHGIKRYIVVSGLGLSIDDDNKCFKTKLLSSAMKLFFPAIIKDKQKEYSILKESNLDWTIVRLPFIKLNEVEAPLKLSLNDCPGNTINATDLANFLINQLTDKTFIRKSPFISN